MGGHILMHVRQTLSCISFGHLMGFCSRRITSIQRVMAQKTAESRHDEGGSRRWPARLAPDGALEPCAGECPMPVHHSRRKWPLSRMRVKRLTRSILTTGFKLPSIQGGPPIPVGGPFRERSAHSGRCLCPRWKGQLSHVAAVAVHHEDFLDALRAGTAAREVYLPSIR
jgi:hypothetical protein